MNPLLPELTRRFDPSKPVGYLNFSDGRADPKFRGLLAEAFALLYGQGDATPWATVGDWLLAACADLRAAGSAAFRDTAQAEAVIDAAFREVPPAYRAHHTDLLAHQTDFALFTPFFLARACEAALAERAAGTPAGQLVGRSLLTLNDFVGYRPIALLETRPQTDFYPHEKVCSIPLYFRGVGVSPGFYSDIVKAGLELLTKTDGDLLDEACLDPDRLDEISVDPRATDHFHPVNKRPNVLFGEWDPHRIDGHGYYRRFVVRQGTLDALVRWSLVGATGKKITPGMPPIPERLFEAAAVLAGTILMGAGICGTGPTHYDSTVTLTKLVQKIARFRDKFYEQLLETLDTPFGKQLKAEAQKLKQPFGGVRQSLNQAIAAERALHLQERRLAVLFAAMGYPAAARARAAVIPAPAARLTAEIRLRQTAAQHAVRAGKPGEVPILLSEAESLLRRGIECGALIDPWNILGFQALFPTFADRGDTVRDPRAEELILTVGRQFDTYAITLAAASAANDRRLLAELRVEMQDLSAWWDQFATPTVAEMPKVHGGERAEAADHVANALKLWASGGASDPSFWRNHLDGFKTPSAFAQVIEALVEQGDYKAAMALLVTWLGESDSVPLQDPSASFFRLTFRWLRGLTNADTVPVADRAALARRFFELLESNAEDRWQVPELIGGKVPREAGDDDEDDDDEDDDDDSGEFSSAYEGMTYKDSTDDGFDGSVADAEPPGTAPDLSDFSLDADAEPTNTRLRFLAAVARLWRLAARPDLFPAANDRTAAEVVSGWLKQARENFSKLHRLAQTLHAFAIPEPVAGVEGISEYDRRRGVKGQLLEATVQTAVETAAAARALNAVLSRIVELTDPNTGPTDHLPGWEAVAARLERAVLRGDANAVRQVLPTFIRVFRHEPLLVSPPADGGPPAPAVRAQTAQQMVESLLARLPRLGLLRETYQMAQLARGMERNQMPDGRRVSSFDVLFRTAVTATVDALLTAGKDWGDDAAEDGPLASALRQIAESYQRLWVDHSHTLRLSALEAVREDSAWDDMRTFVKDYGGDLFTVRFLTLSNVRGVLGQGAAEWLDREASQGDDEGRTKLVEDWANHDLDRSKAARLFEVGLSALMEHYDEYRDYNTTTTQSDYGENLYILLDFLRLKVGYDRSAWLLRPLGLVHEVLCRRGYDRLAAKWREFVMAKTQRVADELLAELGHKEAEHGIRLRTVRDRLEERFVQPLRVDQAAARVARAALAARDGQPEDNPSFAGLLSALQPLAEVPIGVGLDVPAWVRRLEDELRKVKMTDPDEDDEDESPTHGADEYPLPPTGRLDFDEFRRQIREWDSPIGD